MMRSRLTRLAGLLLAALVVLAALPAQAQDAPPPGAEIRITDVRIDRYPAMTLVVEFNDIGFLDTRDIMVTQDGVPLEYGASTIDQTPVEVGIVLALDTSASMAGEPLAAAKAAANGFIDNMRDQDRVAILSFGEEVRIFTGFTNNKAALRYAVSQLTAEGGTSLYDAVLRTVDLYQGVTNQAELERNLILLTDGSDTTSAGTEEEAVSGLQREGISIVGVGLQGEDFDPGALQRLTTPGKYVEAPQAGQLSDVYGEIQRSLDNRIVVTFNATEEAPRDVTYTVDYRGVTASQVVAVPGFFVPASATTTLPPSFEILATEEPSPRFSSDTLLLLAWLSVGLTVFAFVVLLGWGRATDTVQSRLAQLSRSRAPRSSLDEEESGSFLNRVPLMSMFAKRAEEVAQRQGLLQPIANMLEQADILWRPGEVVAGALGMAVFVSVILGAVTQSFVVVMVAFVVFVLLIAASLRLVAEREKKRFTDQMPDTLGLLATSLRSGQSFLQAMEAVAAEAPEPTAREYQRAIAEVRLGRPIGAAMQGIADRMQSQDFQWVVMATEIQREVGGNLAQVLNIVADTMLQRNRLRREVKALSAEGRISAVVLGSLPIFIFLFLFVSNPDYLNPLIERRAGWAMIAGALTAMAVSFAWLRKIVDIEI
jgi:tight adherence protein B